VGVLEGVRSGCLAPASVKWMAFHRAGVASQNLKVSSPGVGWVGKLSPKKIVHRDGERARRRSRRRQDRESSEVLTPDPQPRRFLFLIDFVLPYPVSPPSQQSTPPSNPLLPDLCQIPAQSPIN